MRRWISMIRGPGARNGAIFLAFFLVVGVRVYLGYDEQQPPAQSVPPEAGSRGESVAPNRGPEVQDGFRGASHPLLHGRTSLELTAHWAPIANGQYVSRLMPQAAQVYLGLQPAKPQQTYTARQFSAFLPQQLALPGQTWALDSDQVAKFLLQFHDRPRMHLESAGRRLGPDGAFAVLRAVSPSYLHIVFRIHAEFDVTPKEWPGLVPPDQLWYTPSYFSGELVVSREKGTVEYFRLGLPSDKTLNVHLTVLHSERTLDAHEIVRVDRMELIGGNGTLVAQEMAWAKAISYAAAGATLQKVFYKFAEINWTPFADAVATARRTEKPILAMVLWGSLDDQSC